MDTTGSKLPTLVPIINPSTGVNPIVVFIDFPFFTAVIDEPFPRWHMMIFALRDCLIELGVQERNIAIELFTTPGDKNLSPIHLTQHVVVDPMKECHVTVRLDGDTTEFSLAYGGLSILDAAAAAGIDVPFSCKGGVCCTCKAMLLDGEVDMDVVYGLEPDEIEDGFVLTCQSHPRSETVLVDYDIR